MSIKFASKSFHHFSAPFQVLRAVQSRGNFLASGGERFLVPSSFFTEMQVFFAKWVRLLQLEPADPDFYRIGYVRSVRAYGMEFIEGPNEFGVYASKDVELLRRARTDWDLRLACLLLYAFYVEGNFWQFYGDFLPSSEECTSLILAHKDDLLELQDPNLATKMEEQQKRAIEFWKKHWVSLGREIKVFPWVEQLRQRNKGVSLD
ncbi:protein PLASTID TRANSCRIPTIONALLY ACTIVE 14 isoform X2 [Canna indica]|uniref:Protein PLASTID TRANSCRIPTIONALLY ACTIVE 14 isoform X2 n=1 Tax=Canna indica TaxID=4628 RepID=A0AAQ3QT52_9LILI|nr:protein PLASTID TRANSCRIPTIONALLY ACTIVE 14 isoform X2 [Canna indica]